MLAKRRIPKWMRLTALALMMTVFMSSGLIFATDTYKFKEETANMPSTVDITYYNTIRREKISTSSLYITDINSTTNYSDIRVYGSHTEGITSGVDCTYGTPKSIKIGGQAYLPNLVRERGYSMAGLRLKLSKTRGAYVHFKWQVDQPD